jgi:hypothetical protein
LGDDDSRRSSVNDERNGEVGAASDTGEKAALFVDKLAERLAFERSGERLYEVLMMKCRAAGDAAARRSRDWNRSAAKNCSTFK